MLDVSHLPDYGFDSRSPVWWGNVMLMLIESTTILLLLAAYFYCWRNFEQWPPPLRDQPSWYNAFPSLVPSTANLVIMLATCITMYMTDMAARRMQHRGVLIGLWFMFVISIITIILRFFEFRGLRFKWDDNAYASIIWTILGLQLTYLLMMFGEFFIMGLWLIFHRLDKHHAHDITLAGGSWYWVAGSYLIIYVVIYLSPRLL